MSVKPITPEEAHKQFCETQIPDFIIETINKLLSQNASLPNCRIVIKQEDIIQEAIKHPDFPKGSSRQSFFDYGWLNIESIYDEAGWNATYDKPSYNENYDTFFTFIPKKS